jgi:hypothetical protein
VWAYGFYVQGNAFYWNDTTAPITDFLGQFPVKATYPVLYVEDCKMSYCRHAVDAIQGGWIVTRYCYVDHPYPTNFGQLEVHGSEGGSWSSARGFEFYNNQAVGEAGHAPELCWLRGGGGVIYDNAFTTVDAGYCIVMIHETCPAQPDEECHNIWIWDNTKDAGTLLDDADFVLDTDYFLREPTVPLDGFAYTPYTYPHPLISLEGFADGGAGYYYYNKNRRKQQIVEEVLEPKKIVIPKISDAEIKKAFDRWDRLMEKE